MKLALKKEMRRKSLKREVKQAQFRFWQAEEKFERILLRWCKMPITHKRFGRFTVDKDIVKREMIACEQELKIAKRFWDNYLHSEKKKEIKHVIKAKAVRRNRKKSRGTKARRRLAKATA